MRKRKEKAVPTPYKNVYTPLIEDESFEWRWELDDVLTVDEMWTSGVSILDIAKHFKRDPDEVLILILDRVRMNRIKERPGGLAGTK